MLNRLTTAGSAAAIGVLAASPVWAAPGDVLFTSDLSTNAGLTVLGTSDTTSEFGYDYSADGIPAAPNGTGTVGLKLTANNGDAVTGAEEIAVVTTDAITAPAYSVSLDVWVNAVGPFPGGGAGSTEFGGLGIGHDGTTLGRDGGTFIYTGEGGSSRDYRLYKDTNEQFYASGQYDAALASNNASDPVFVAAFPGLTPPASQGDATTTADGVGGFQWMTIEAVVDTVSGTASFTIASDTSGNIVPIGTIDSNVGDSFTTTGSVAIVFADLFSSIAGDASLAFGVYDNLTVTEIPEPASLLLVGLGGLTMLRRRSA